ncbi:MAG: hypothetical protein IPI66_03405 [Chitinophagaceae bacterium]|nr:hypothetical protein [Chitinophagaceae bacterium]MBL0055400.1 hypothetical protein [Chitinophagaceae bacterium]
MDKIISISLYGCAVKKTETKEGIELEIRALNPDTGMLIDKQLVDCYARVDYLGNVTCHKIACTGSCEKETKEGFAGCSCKKT